MFYAILLLDFILENFNAIFLPFPSNLNTGSPDVRGAATISFMKLKLVITQGMKVSPHPELIAMSQILLSYLLPKLAFKVSFIFD